MKYHRLICWFASALTASLPLLVMAQMIYERKQVTIEAARAEQGDEATKSKPLPAHDPATYDIELRGEDALKLEYVHTLNNLTPSNGVMIALNAPAITALPNFNVYTPIDVLFIADDGTILQIMPSAILAETKQTIQASEPVKAFLFLKSGQAAARAIMPRDVVHGSMFNLPPTIQK